MRPHVLSGAHTHTATTARAIPHAIPRASVKQHPPHAHPTQAPQQNPAMMDRLNLLKDDPELKDMFEDMTANGANAFEKYCTFPNI
jgi:hypothetical protein